MLTLQLQEMEAPATTGSPKVPSPATTGSPKEKLDGYEPKEELDGYEPEPLLREQPSALPLQVLVQEASKSPSMDGSLPWMPLPAVEEDTLYQQSLEIITRYLQEQATGSKDMKPLGSFGATSRRALETLRQVGDLVQHKHKMVFQGMLQKLDIKNTNNLKYFFQITVHVFTDGITNWGRIVTLISFGAFVAKHLKSINQESCIEPLAENITDILIRTKRDWLVKQRGWDGFVESFCVEDLESQVRRKLLAFVGIAGVGACLAYIVRWICKCNN